MKRKKFVDVRNQKDVLMKRRFASLNSTKMRKKSSKFVFAQIQDVKTKRKYARLS